MKAYLFLAIVAASIVQTPDNRIAKVHSHNDYTRERPFYEAYESHAASIEADIFATDKPGELLVAHNKSDLPHALSLDSAYISPLKQVFKMNGGRAWKDSDLRLVLLVDLKTPTEPTLSTLVAKLEDYPEVFDYKTNPYAVQVVITGNIPDGERFADYPDFIMFDAPHFDFTPEQLKRIFMFSFPFYKFADWQGIDPIENPEKVVEQIKKAHLLDRPIRFWGAPDNELAWKTLFDMGADYINTDRPKACVKYFDR